MIDQINNYDDVFFRMVNTSLCKTLTKQIRWINRFSDKKIRVIVPFYMSYSGSDRYLLDAFVDDVVDQRIELNTDIIPRGVITLQSFSSVSDEFANPNQYISKNSFINQKSRKIISKVKAIPMRFSYECEIRLDSEIDSYKCSEKLLNMFFNYMFFNIEYYGLKIDAVLNLPDDKEVSLPREITLDSDIKKVIKFSFDVKTYYPMFYNEYRKNFENCFGSDSFTTITDDDFEICDNDDEIDWNKLKLKKPSEVLDCLEKSGIDYNTIKRVYWSALINRDEDQYGTSGTTSGNVPYVSPKQK